MDRAESSHAGSWLMNVTGECMLGARARLLLGHEESLMMMNAIPYHDDHKTIIRPSCRPFEELAFTLS